MKLRRPRNPARVAIVIAALLVVVNLAIWGAIAQEDGPATAARPSEIVVLFPEENQKDLKDVPESVLAEIAVIPVKHMDEVLRHALAHPQPEEFLREPSSVVDWRIVETMPPDDPRDAH